MAPPTSQSNVTATGPLEYGRALPEKIRRGKKKTEGAEIRRRPPIQCDELSSHQFGSRLGFRWGSLVTGERARSRGRSFRRSALDSNASSVSQFQTARRAAALHITNPLKPRHRRSLVMAAQNTWSGAPCLQVCDLPNLFNRGKAQMTCHSGQWRAEPSAWKLRSARGRTRSHRSRRADRRAGWSSESQGQVESVDSSTPLLISAETVAGLPTLATLAHTRHAVAPPPNLHSFRRALLRIDPFVVVVVDSLAFRCLPE
ncbi:uncharacterized protein B0T15DRAFT_7550 [Chaetomium strumarium]|uniref:Uncharacterized protein n=1 Tax=Chaetomium strumarium TaxID=1170767 RepID=A0AAJ0H0J1_9PEZI|nr:hypothetical protein B0T15DRAFT_7550 [Chaetomium strumarium]